MFYGVFLLSQAKQSIIEATKLNCESNLEWPSQVSSVPSTENRRDPKSNFNFFFKFCFPGHQRHRTERLELRIGTGAHPAGLSSHRRRQRQGHIYRVFSLVFVSQRVCNRHTLGVYATVLGSIWVSLDFFGSI